MKKSPQIFWTILLLGIIVLIWALTFFVGGDTSKVVSDFPEPRNSDAEVLPLGEGQVVEVTSSNTKLYKHSILGFSFEYPKEYDISSFGNYFDSSGVTILLQKENGDNGIQIVITPFDEDIALTVERIKKDLPTLSIINPKKVQIGGETSGVSMVTFLSENNLSAGKSTEAWFVYKRNLYQVSGLEASGDLFDTILKSWNLQE